MLHRPSSCTHALATTPAESLGASVALFPRRSQPSLRNARSASASNLSRPAQRSLTLGLCTRQSPQVTLCTEGFNRFVTSAAASIATGWNDSCRMGFAPTGRPCLCTAHVDRNHTRTRTPATHPALYIKEGKQYSALTADAALQRLRDWAAARFSPGTQVLNSPTAVEAFLLSRLAGLHHEVFAVILLDRHYRLIDYVEISHGTRDMAPVRTREIVKVALAREAQAVICVHNHPSGSTEASEADVAVTRGLTKALALVEVRLLDHFIIGDRVMSFAERGLLRA